MRYRKRKKAASQVMRGAVIAVVALSLLFVIAGSQVFTVRSIMVVGNRALTSEDVIAISGVAKGDNMLGISDALLKRNLEKNRYIEYISREFDYKGTLTLRINERMGMAVANVYGNYYVVDESGMVLENTGGTFPDTVYGPKVIGFALESNARVLIGEKLPVVDQEQLRVMGRVLTQLSQLNLLARANTLSVNDLDNLFVSTTDGATILLGDDSDLGTKLLIAREVLFQLDESGSVQGEKIDISNAAEAHHIPATLPTITPVPTSTPSVSPSISP